MQPLQDLYNGLREVSDASKIVDAHPDVISSLASLLVQHKLNESFEIRLNHKHFDITEGEQVVGFNGKGMAVSTVCKDGELPLDLLSAEGINPVPGGSIIPSDFLVKDGLSIPYEFAYAPGNTVPGPDSKFLEEWTMILAQKGLDNLLGLSVIDHDVPFGAFETSDSGMRVNRLDFQHSRPVERSFVTTTWRADVVDGHVQAKKCNFCDEIRRHEKHCNQY